MEQSQSLAMSLRHSRGPKKKAVFCFVCFFPSVFLLVTLAFLRGKPALGTCV